MSNILQNIKLSIKKISILLRENSTETLSESYNTKNESGDSIKKIDLLSHNIFMENLISCKDIKYLISEESKSYININDKGTYCVAYDPLDGSSNVSLNITTGSIFAIYNLDKKKIELAGYSLYGPSTQLVLADKDGVNLYQLIDNEFIIIKENIKMPNKGNTYLVNYSKKYKFDSKWNILFDIMIKNNYNCRWSGSLVTDAHRILMNGGFFTYPINLTSLDGKIRLIYEAQPIAFIIEKAGGKSWGYNKTLTDLNLPEEIHLRTPIILSSKNEFEDFKNIFKI